MDVLTDVLSLTRTGGAVLARTRLASPWGCRLEGGGAAGFHLVGHGSCWIRMPRRAPFRILQGDLVLVPCGATHTLSDPVDAPTVPLAELLQGVRAKERPAAAQPRRRKHPAEDRTELVCGVYQYDHDGPHPLLSLLPDVLHVTAAQVQACEPLHATMRMLVEETGRAAPGSTVLVERLVDVLLVYVVRQWLASQPEGEAGWLGALRDAQVARALELLHDDVKRDWSVAELARAVGVSRASLARRFTQLVGLPPGRYLARLRIDAAARLLRQTTRPLAAIAGEVGYESEYAFNRAFKRSRRIAPGAYRREANRNATAS